MLQKGNYLKLETRYVKTVFRNGIYDKFCIRMGVFWIFDKIEENRYFFIGLPPLLVCMCDVLAVLKFSEIMTDNSQRFLVICNRVNLNVFSNIQ